jgi:hypothetical protein
MKKTRRIISIFSLVLVFSFQTACSGIFILDPIDPRLPKYTEEGNQVAGAFVDDQVWKSVVTSTLWGISYEPSVRSWPQKDSLQIIFSGNMEEGDYTVGFQLKGYKISKVADLMALDGKKIELDGVDNAGYWMPGYSSSVSSNRGIGQIYFKKVKKIESSSSIIISGTFGFKISDNNGVSTIISSGRFDYRISNVDNIEVY